MDELFQRAAENFPLKEPDNHWNAIQSRLDDGSTQPAAINSNRPIILYGLLAIMCLHLPFMLFDNVYTDKKYEKNIVFEKNGTQEEFYQGNEYNKEWPAADNVMLQADNEANIFDHARILIAGAQPKTDHTIPHYNDLNEIIEVADSTTNDEIVVQPDQENGKQTSSETNQVTILQPDSLIVDKASVMDATARSVMPDTVTSKVDKNPVKKPSSGLYAGINTGISLSVVKGQQLSSPGFTAGIGLGYRFSPSWSAETGIKFSEKKYFSDGAHFSKKAMPPGMKVVSVNSRTLLLEIPIKAKVDFIKTAKGQYFLTGGFSTFVVGKETNDYIIFRNGINSPMNATYNDNQSYLAATIEVSAGYERYFKNKQTLRIEPWLQVARKGIGIGQLPVSGFGIQAGYFFLK